MPRTHSLIEPALAAEDCHTIKPAWGSDDTPAWQGHGTRMAGVGLYGDLVPMLVGSDPIALPHRLESVRILPPEDKANDPDRRGDCSRRNPGAGATPHHSLGSHQRKPRARPTHIVVSGGRPTLL
ncbi:S8 family serine peptidase [Bradyrhizobium sp. UFLA05-153]